MWGLNYSGEIGNGTKNEATEHHQLTPIKVLDSVKKVSVGGKFGERYSSAITTSGDLYMWGANDYGKIGNGTTEDQLIPYKVTAE